MLRLAFDQLVDRAALQPTDAELAGPLEGLRVLADELDRRDDLSAVGRRLAHDDLVRVLTQFRAGQLDLVEPGSGDYLAIVGLPRTGSTLLQQLLFAATSVRAVPFAATLWPDLDDQSAAEARARDHLRLLERASPSLLTLHPTRAEWPDECINLLQFTGMSERFVICYQPDEYREYLASQDMTNAYGRLRELTERGSRPGSGPTLLKAPSHLPHVRTLRTQFAGVRFLWTHRDPDRCMRSYGRLLIAARRVVGLSPSPDEMVAESRRWWSTHLEQALLDRPEMDVCDVLYDDLTTDPRRTVRAVADWCGLDLDDEQLDAAIERMAQYAPTRGTDVALDESDASPDAASPIFAAYRELVTDPITVN